MSVCVELKLDRTIIKMEGDELEDKEFTLDSNFSSPTEECADENEEGVVIPMDIDCGSGSSHNDIISAVE